MAKTKLVFLRPLSFDNHFPQDLLEMVDLTERADLQAIQNPDGSWWVVKDRYGQMHAVADADIDKHLADYQQQHLCR